MRRYGTELNGSDGLAGKTSTKNIYGFSKIYDKIPSKQLSSQLFDK